ncbi:UNVERIFIED_CONTAM: hypothetical protein K2H54_023882 [Gekko kuhli]
MDIPQGRWLYLFTLTCFLAVVLNSVGSKAQVEPALPGEDASYEELVKFFTEYLQYLNAISKLRCGNKSARQTVPEDGYTISDY